MPRRIIYDCDGVMFNYVKGFGTFLRDVEGLTPCESGPASYDMLSWTGLEDPADFHRLIARFNSGEGDYFANLEPLPGAVEAVLELRDLGFTDHVLTSSGIDPRTVAGRHSNLNAHFGKGFASIVCLELGVSKRSELLRHAPSWFVEDHPGNAVLGAEAGHKSLLIVQSHNISTQTLDDVEQVNDWEAIRSRILGSLYQPLMGM